MSLLAALRCSSFTAKQISSGVARRTTPALGAVPHKTFAVTPVRHMRIYGPEAENDKIDDLHHWKNERYVALSLIPIIPAALIYPNLVTDTLLVSAMVLHSYWRLSGVAEDYIHGQFVPKMVQPMIKLLTILVFGSLCYFNYFDIGFAEAARKVYTEL